MNWQQLKDRTLTMRPSGFESEAATHSSGLTENGRTWLGVFWKRMLIGLALLGGLFLLYRFIWLTGWYWPYRMIRHYLEDRLPMADPWAVETLALLVAVLIAAQMGAIMSFVLLGRHQRLMIGLALAGVVLHGGLSWYSYGRVVVDEQGGVRVRVVEKPNGELKVIDRAFDPETGQRARVATEADLVMLDLQRRGLSVQRVGMKGPFRSAQGTINVYYTRRDGQIILYTGPRHPEVSGDMPRATDEMLRDFIRQQRRP
jgi:hypothetical protein